MRVTSKRIEKLDLLIEKQGERSEKMEDRGISYSDHCSGDAG